MSTFLSQLNSSGRVNATIKRIVVFKRDVYVYRLHCAALVAGPQSVKPSRIIAGQEPEKTNEFLQTIARAVHRKVLSFYMQ